MFVGFGQSSTDLLQEESATQFTGLSVGHVCNVVHAARDVAQVYVALQKYGVIGPHVVADDYGQESWLGSMHRLSEHLTNPNGHVDRVGHVYMDAVQVLRSEAHKSLFYAKHVSKFP